MAEFIIPATTPKFEGAAVRDLAQDDLLFQAWAYRHRRPAFAHCQRL